MNTDETQVMRDIAISPADEDVRAHGNNSPTPTGWHTRGYLPHYDNWEVIQMVTYRLADALPRDVAERLAREAEIEADTTANADEDVRAPRETRGQAEYRKRIEAFLDAGHGECLLKRQDVASVVADALNHSNNKEYKLHSWVIMPNHVHVLVEPLMPYSLAKIVQAWKSFTAHEINRKVDRNGKLWQDEYWDRFMRNGEHYRSSINYIVENPVKAGLVEHASDWPWTFPTTERPKIERSPGSADVPVRIM